MKTLFLALALSLAAAPAFANLQKLGKMERYGFNVETNKPMTLKVTINHKTKDGCNHFGLDGGFRRLEIPVGTQTMMQDLVADFGIMGTLMGCADLDQPREILLESDPYVLKPINGWISGTVTVPAGAKVTLE